MLLNAGVASGLFISYIEGSPIWIVVICGIFLLALVNVIAMTKIRKQQAKADTSD